MSVNRIFKFINVVLALFFITSAHSQTNATVTSLLDDGSPGTLRWAITTANSDSNTNGIDFTPSLTGTITLTSDLPVITSNLTIFGPGALSLTISGNNLYKMFIVNNGSVLTLSGISFIANTSFNGSVFRADSNNSSIVADSIIVTGNTASYAFYTNNTSTISISNSTFTNNSSTLFGSDYGSTPSITSDTETDYSNRITVTESTFSSNTGTIFSTERYVKIDNCIFSENTGQIGGFRGLNRYQVLNSTFTNNTGWSLFSFSSTLSTGTFLATLGTNQHLFDGNTFTGNTGTVISTGSANEQSKTSISNNIFSNNGTSYTGSPAVVNNNTLDNFITSITHSVLNSTITITMSRPVFNTNTGSGDLEANDFQFSLSGGNATLVSSTPSSIAIDGNVYILGIDVSGEISGLEMLTVNPISNSIYDAFNLAGTSQQNNTTHLNFLDDDADGVSNFLDNCPNTVSGVRITNDGCEDTSYPFITYYDYGSTLIYPQNIVSISDGTLYFISYDSSWNQIISKLTPEKNISTFYTVSEGYVYNLKTDSSGNLYFIYYDYITNLNELKKITPDGTVSVLHSINNGNIQNLTMDSSGNLYFVCNDYDTNLYELKKITPDGTVSILQSNSNGSIQTLTTDTAGNLYFTYYDNSNNSYEIKKITSDGTTSSLYSTSNGNIQNLTTDAAGNLFFVYYNNNTNSYELKKMIPDGTVSSLYSINEGNIEGYTRDNMDNLYVVAYDFNTGKRKINKITPEGILTSYGEYTGNELSRDSSGNIFFFDYQNNKIMGSKISKLLPTLSNFNSLTKKYFDGSFTIIDPTSTSSAAFAYVSDNTNVATISGNIVTITGIGTTNITATQAADVNYDSNAIASTLKVIGVSVLTKNGAYSNTDANYIDKNGKIGVGLGMSKSGEIKSTLTITDTTDSVAFETYYDLELGASCSSCDMDAPSSYDLKFAAGGGTIRARMWWNEQHSDMAMVYDKSFQNINSTDINNYYYCDYIGDSNNACMNVDTPPTNFTGIYRTNEGNYYAVQYISEGSNEVTFKYKKLN